MIEDKELWNYKIQRDREEKQMKEQVKKLKRWRAAVVIAVVMLALSNVVLFVSNHILRETHAESLMKMNAAYQNLRQDYEDVSEHATYLLEKLRAQTQNPGNDVRSRASGE